MKKKLFSKKGVRRSGFYVLVVLIVTASIFFLLVNKKIFFGDDPTKMQVFQICGFDELPADIKLDNTPFVINEKVSSMAGWKKYEIPNFSVYYPEYRKIYSEETGFHMCPVGSCQDAEMYLVNGSTNGCGNIKHRFNFGRQGYERILWTNLNVGGYPGVALSVVPDPLTNRGDISSGLSGVIYANNELYQFAIGFDQQHFQILSSFVAE